MLSVSAEAQKTPPWQAGFLFGADSTPCHGSLSIQSVKYITAGSDVYKLDNFWVSREGWAWSLAAMSGTGGRGWHRHGGGWAWVQRERLAAASLFSFYLPIIRILYVT